MDSTEKREQETASLKKIGDSFKKIVIVRKHLVVHEYLGFVWFFLRGQISFDDSL